jgi:putative ABC transport system permease protein
VIGIVWVMLRARWARALVICALASFTVAVAAALPAYLARADEAMISTEVSRASAAEATISVRIDVPAVPAAHGSVTSASDFAVAETRLFAAPWLTTIYATDIDIDTANAAPGGSDTATIPEVAFRQGYCDHVVIVAGRCPVATREILLDTALAARLHVGVGDTLPLHQARTTVDGWVARPAYGVVSVVGTYRVPNVDDPYWGTQAYFSTAGPARGNVLPIFAQPSTVDALPHDSERVYVDGLLRPAGLAGADLATVRARVEALRRPGSQATAATSMPALLDRITADRTTLRQVVPGLAVPVIVVGAFALFLAVAHAGVGRRPEFAVIGLRGLARADRWWLGAGESLIAVVIAVPLGLAAGSGLARLAAAATLGGATLGGATLGGATLGGATLGGATASVASGAGPVAELAIGLVFLAALAGCSRPAAARITDLLRRVPNRRTAWRSVPAQAALVVLAIFTVVQLRIQPGPPTGVTLVASSLVVAGVAVLLGPLVPMLAARVGRRAITSRARAAATPDSTAGERLPADGRSSTGWRSKGRRPGRGRIGLGLGALAVARRPGARRLLVVAAIATGMAGFAVAVSVAAANSRTAYVNRELGAPTVLSIGSTTPGYLLRAVRAADPSGRYAMAVMAVPQLGPTEPPLLALDASRLAAIATPPPGVRLGAVANALQASALPDNGLPANGLPANGFAPVTVTGGAVRIDVTASSAEPPIDLVASLLSSDGVAVATADFGRLTAGRHTYDAAVDCAGGCRLVGLTLTPQADASVATTVTVHALASSAGIDSPAPKPVAVPLSTAARWRAAPAALEPATVSAGSDGLTLAVSSTVDAGNGTTIVPVTGAYPVPVVDVGGAAPHTLSGLDATAVDVRPADRVTALPRVGDRGTLVDLDALTLAAVRPATPLPGEVWLAAGTPPAVVSALSNNGLLVASQRTATAQRAYLSAQGPAVGVAFGLAGAGALMVLAVGCLLLVSGVERGDRTADLLALRIQGLSRHAAARSLVVSQLALIVAAAILGYAAGAAAWLLTSDHIPVLVTAGGPHLAPFMIPFAAMGVGVAAATAVLGVVALVAALASAATVTTSGRWSP